MGDYTKRTVILHTRQLHYIASTCCLMAFCSSLNLLSSLYNTWKLLPASSWDLAIRSVCIFNSLSALPRSLKNKCEVKHNYRIKCFIYPWIFILFIKYNYKQPCKFYKSCIHLFHFEFTLNSNVANLYSYPYEILCMCMCKWIVIIGVFLTEDRPCSSSCLTLFLPFPRVSGPRPVSPCYRPARL